MHSTPECQILNGFASIRSPTFASLHSPAFGPNPPLPNIFFEILKNFFFWENKYFFHFGDIWNFEKEEKKIWPPPHTPWWSFENWKTNYYFFILAFLKFWREKNIFEIFDPSPPHPPTHPLTIFFKLKRKNNIFWQFWKKLLFYFGIFFEIWSFFFLIWYPHSPSTRLNYP